MLIQTPTSKMTYEARFAQIVNGRERNKRIDFEGEADFRAWYGESRANAAMVLDVETEPGQVISLVTCSYNIWVDNERTVLVAGACRKQPRIKPKIRKSRQRRILRPFRRFAAMLPGAGLDTILPRPRRNDSVGSFSSTTENRRQVARHAR